MPGGPPSLLGCTRDELRNAFAARGLEAYRADQVLRWVFGAGILDLEHMTDLGRRARHALLEHFQTDAPLALHAVHASSDGTQKLELETVDGSRIESVIIPEARRRTVCISSQVGCSLDCRFCATGLLGFGRNLTAAEIVAQWVHAVRVLSPSGERPTHVVFMGMGEPLLNLRHVVQAIRVLCDPRAGCLSPRRITVSTAGVVPRMADLGQQTRVRLAISLHATTDALRDELVPLNRRFPLATLLDACRRYPVARRDRISFEYVLLRGVNDRDEDARRLGALLRGLPAKINLIPLNEHTGVPYRRPDDLRVDAFAGLLARQAVPVSVRRSRGDDILAACGQLGALAPRVGAAIGRKSGASQPIREMP